MGARNPDRIPLSHRRSRCETVAQMLQQQWQVTATCRTCRVALRVDLRTIATIRGAGFSLWNRNSRCRVVGCSGVVAFSAKAPGMVMFEPLATAPAVGGPPPPPAWLARRGPDA